MWEFKSEDTFTVKGRGTVYCIPERGLPKNFTYADQDKILEGDTKISIDGKQRLARGFERYTVIQEQTEFVKAPIAILVYDEEYNEIF